MSTFKLYVLFSLLPTLSSLFAILSVIFVGILIIALALLFDKDNTEDGNSLFLKVAKFLSIPAICCVLLYGIIPSKDAIFKIYIAKYITTDKDIKQIPHVFLEYISSEIKKNEDGK